MKLTSYVLAMVLLAITVRMSIGTYVQTNRTHDDYDTDNDSENQKCYHAGFEAG